jgi:hypothetical protein
MSTNPTDRKDSDKAANRNSPIVLAGAFVGTGLAVVAAVLFVTRTQPAPEPAPEPPPAQAPAKTAAPQDVPLPAPPSAVAAPGEATTIVLEDPSTAGAPPAAWDGKSARGMEDGPTVLQAAVAAVGGERVLPDLGRFTARFTTSQPVFATGELAFDAKLGITMRRTDAPVTLTLNSAGACVQWRSTQRIAASCTASQVILMESLWHAGRVWAIAPLRSGTLKHVSMRKWPQYAVNSLLIQHGQADGKEGEVLSAEFDVATGVLRRATLPTRAGATFARFANQRAAMDGATVATEWSIFPATNGRAAEPAAVGDKAAATPQEEMPELSMPEQGLDGPFVMHFNAFRAGTDRDVFVVPRRDELNKPVAAATLTPDAVPARFLEFAMDKDGAPSGSDLGRLSNSWVAALSDWVVIVEDGKPLRLGLGLSESISMPAELQKRVQPLVVGAPLVGAVVPYAGDAASLRTAVVSRVEALGRKVDGPVYMTVWANASLEGAMEPGVRGFGSAVMVVAP